MEFPVAVQTVRMNACIGCMQSMGTDYGDREASSSFDLTQRAHTMVSYTTWYLVKLGELQ